MAKKLPLISVVICSFNGADVIYDAIKAVKSQKWAGKLEIIVVDDGSTDDTQKIAKSFRGIKVIRNKRNLGIAKSRNVGIKAAKGGIIAFTDDDCRPRPTWIRELYAGYKDDKIMAVGGNLIASNKKTLISRYSNVNQRFQPADNKTLASKNPFYRFTGYLKILVGIKKPNYKKRAVYSLPTANLSFRKTALKKIGTFDSRFVFAGEDSDYCKRLNKIYPGSLMFAPKARVIHQLDGNLRDTLRRSEAYGVGAAQLLRKHRDFIPAFYPFPLIILLTFFLGFLNLWFLFTPFILIAIVYSLGIRTAIKKRNFEPLSYGYIQFLQELYNNLGFIKGWFKFRNAFVSKNKSRAGAKLTTTGQQMYKINKGSDLHDKKPKKNDKFWQETITAITLLVLILAASLLKRSTFLHIPSAIAIILLSGYLLLRGYGVERQKRSPMMLRLALSMVLGVAWLMFFGLAADVILPIFGIKHPLTSDWLILLFAIATGLLLPWSLKYKVAVKKVSSFNFNWDTVIISSLLILTIFFSFFGARLLNNGYANVPIILAFITAILSVILAVIRQDKLPKFMFPLVLFVISLASVWSYSLRSNYVFGWDIQQEFHVFQETLSSGRWILGAKHLPYEAMLSLTVLPVTVAKLSGLSGLTIYKVLAPTIFSFVPVILYYAYRNFVKRWMAFLAAMLVICALPVYMSEFAALVRQQFGLLFFSCILYLLVQTRLTRRTKNYLLAISMVGLVVSHYTTTYLTILFFGVTYVLGKIIIFLVQHKKIRNAELKNKYFSGWMIVFLIVTAILWYGPATHSNTTISKLTTKSNYSHLIQSFEKEIKSHIDKHSYDPKTTEDYLSTIGKQFHIIHKKLKLYPNATNKTLKPLSNPIIKPHWTLLETVSNALNYILEFGWWLLAGLGISALMIGLIRVFNIRKFEIGVLCTIGTASIVVFVALPTLQEFYSAERLAEQVLMFTALPAIITAAWILKRLSELKRQVIILACVVLSFAFASGIVTQFVGGQPDANLNNFGSSYNDYYVYQTDVASAKWLGTQYEYTHSAVYVDSLGLIRLSSAKNSISNHITALTPQTISVGSFVYADYADYKLGVSSNRLSPSSQVYLYQFPTEFLEQNKNLVYSNGYSEVYK